MGSVLEIRDLGGLFFFFNCVFLYNLLKIYYWGGNILKFIEKWHAFFMEQVNLFKNMVKKCEGNLGSDAAVLIEIILFVYAGYTKKGGTSRSDLICWSFFFTSVQLSKL